MHDGLDDRPAPLLVSPVVMSSTATSESEVATHLAYVRLLRQYDEDVESNGDRSGLLTCSMLRWRPA
jgi:hypothetical protein